MTLRKKISLGIDEDADNPTHWADILMDVRKEAGLTRPQLSILSGIGTSTIENYEHKKIGEPSIYKIEKLLVSMGYDLDAIKASED
jgi:transcriptional regulator with XRE-family HTH domain|tara:strand:- start:250 stop:507 length:258 start_codon:yes stop_codon:yes gene_type:complete